MLPLDALTEYRRAKGEGEPYPLQAIWFLWKAGDVSFTDYLKEVKRANVAPIAFRDKEDIRGYLDGKIATCDGMVRGLGALAEAGVEVPPLPDSDGDVAMQVAVPGPAPDAQAEGLPVEAGGSPDLRLSQPLTSASPLAPEPFDLGQDMDLGVEGDGVGRKRWRFVAQQELSYERLVGYDSGLRGDGFDFRPLVAQLKEALYGERRAPEPDPTAYADRSFANAPEPARVATRPASFRNWIIVVPRTTEAQINIDNVRQFLEEGSWVSPKSVAGRQKGSFTIEHLHSMKLTLSRYDVVPDGVGMGVDDWARLVAVFVSGKAWQVKNYQPSDPAQLFERCLGIYIGWENERGLPSDIEQWRVKHYRLVKARREDDSQVANEVWEEIERATKAVKERRPHTLLLK